MQVTAGLASVAAGGTLVTGSGTDWTAPGTIVPGLSVFTIVAQPGSNGRIARVAAAGQVLLAAPWPGLTATNAAYAILVDFTPLALPLIHPTAVEIHALWNLAMTRITEQLTLLGEPPTTPLPLIDETTENVAELWNAAMTEITARLAALGVSV